MPGYAYPDPLALDLSWSTEDVWAASPASLDFSFSPGATYSFFTIESASSFSFDAENRHFAFAGQASAAFSASVAWQGAFSATGASSFVPETSERAFSLTGETNAWFTTNDPGYSLFVGSSVSSVSLFVEPVTPASLSTNSAATVTFNGTYSASGAFSAAVESSCAFKGLFNKDVTFVARCKSESMLVSAADASASFSIVGRTKAMKRRRYTPTPTPVHPPVYGQIAAFSVSGKTAMKLVGAHG